MTVTAATESTDAGYWSASLNISYPAMTIAQAGADRAALRPPPRNRPLTPAVLQISFATPVIPPLALLLLAAWAAAAVPPDGEAICSRVLITSKGVVATAATAPATLPAMRFTHSTWLPDGVRGRAMAGSALAWAAAVVGEEAEVGVGGTVLWYGRVVTGRGGAQRAGRRAPRRGSARPLRKESERCIGYAVKWLNQHQ